MSAADPQWAWSDYEPGGEHPWNEAAAAHLFRRAGFAANHRELADAIAHPPAEAVRRLVAEPSGSAELARESNAFAETVLATGDPKQLSAWWVYTLLKTPVPLVEKMTLFWHGHFATSADKVQDAEAMYRQNSLLRRYALGDFAELVREMSRDPAMLIYLDSATNRKAHPNENYARELLELFCLGEGNYSERDVQELARCFTGWEIRRNQFRFNRFQHDSGEKTILGRSGVFPDDSIIDLVLEQPSAAQFIVGKLIRFFVCDEPAPSEQLIEPLARQLREENWHIAAVVERILKSNFFFSSAAIGRKVRSPVDFTIGLLRALEGSTNVQRLAEGLFQLGQGLFYPPNVKGWDGGRAWINAATLLERANLAGQSLTDEATRFAGGDLASYLEAIQVRSGPEIVEFLARLLLAVPLPDDARERLVQLIDSGSGSSNERVIEVLRVMTTLPVFQLC